MITKLKKAIAYILTDKVNFTLASFPVILGLILYFFAGRWAFTTVMDYGQEFINSHVSGGTISSVLNYLLVGILTVVMFFAINWTFVLVVSVFASPFNDLISSRIAKKENGMNPEGLGEGIANMLKGSLGVIWNELKKVAVIAALTIFAIVLSYIPLLAPVSISISALLLAAQFSDYNWSRHNLRVSGCINDVRANLITYGISGFIFLFFISIPIINLLVAPLATSFYAVVWAGNHPGETK